MRAWLAVFAVAAVLLAFATSQLGLRTDVTHFLPEQAAGEGALVRALAASAPTRGMVLSVGARRPARARAAARELAERLRAHPEIAWARVTPDPELPAALHATYFHHRLGFLAETPEEIDALTADAALRAAARSARARLAAPGGSAWAGLVARDPLGGFERILARVRGTDPGLRVEAGQFVSPDGRHALLLVQTRPPAFDTARQAPLVAAIGDAFAALRLAHSGDDLVLEASGINRFAVRIERTIRGDALRIALVSVAGLGLLFVGLLRAPRLLGLAFLPPLLGMLVAVCAGIVLLGDLDVLTLAFGTSLTGVAIDYAIHLVNHHAFAPPGTTPAATRRALRPTLALGAFTTIASFAGLALTDFPGFREMGLIAMIGVAVALAVTLGVLPVLLGPERPAPAAERLAGRLARGAERLAARRPASLLVLVACLAVAAMGLPRLHWSNDLRGLSQLDPQLVAEDRRVRERLSQFDTSRLVLLRAGDEATALERNRKLSERLEEAVGHGALDGIRSLHALLWPAELQRQSQAAVRGDPELGARIEAAFVAEGFRAGAVAPFLETLAAPPPAPLTLDGLQASPLAPLVDSLVAPVGDDLALITYLRGVRQEGRVAAAVAEVPGARLFDQTALIDDLFGEFRATTLRQMAVGSGLVVLLLAARYRRWRPTVAALLPSVATAVLLLGGLGLLGQEANLLHAISLLLVMGMGVDYGIFVVDARDRPGLEATLLSLLLSCLTTVFVFGTLALSSHPALRAIGVTTGVGVALSFVLAPLARAIAHPKS